MMKVFHNAPWARWIFCGLLLTSGALAPKADQFAPHKDIIESTEALAQFFPDPSDGWRRVIDWDFTKVSALLDAGTSDDFGTWVLARYTRTSDGLSCTLELSGNSGYHEDVSSTLSMPILTFLVRDVSILTSGDMKALKSGPFYSAILSPIHMARAECEDEAAALDLLARIDRKRVGQHGERVGQHGEDVI